MKRYLKDLLVIAWLLLLLPTLVLLADQKVFPIRLRNGMVMGSRMLRTTPGPVSYVYSIWDSPIMTSDTTPTPIEITYDSSAYAGWYAFDGDVNNRWQSAYVDFPHWITMDLGAGSNATPNSIVITPMNGYNFKHFTLEGSSDNAAWHTLLDTNSPNSYGGSEIYPLTGAGPYRYFKTTLLDGWNGDNWGIIYEVSLTSAAFLPAMTASNTPAPYTVIADSTLDENAYGGWRAFDQDDEVGTAHRWITIDPYPHWVTVDYTTNTVVQRASMTTRVGLGYEHLSVRGSADNEAWTTLYETNGIPQAEGVYVFSFTNQTPYRYYQLYSTNGYNMYNCQVTEFRLWQAVPEPVVPPPYLYTPWENETMTDLTTPSPVTISSSMAWQTDVWKLFDRESDAFIVTADTYPQWFKYDCGAGNARVVCSFVLKAIGAGLGPKDFILQGSNDDASWVDMISATAVDTGTYQFYTNDVSKRLPYRYIRFYATSGYAEPYMYISELEFGSSIDVVMTDYNTPAPYVVTNNAELYAENTPAWASTSHGAAGQWIAGPSYTNWCMVDLGAPKFVRWWSLFNSGYNMDAFNISASANGVNWTSLYGTNGLAGMRMRQFDTLNTTPYRYYRLDTHSTDYPYMQMQFMRIKISQ